MNKILESKYFSLALAAVIAIVVFFVTKVTEDLPTAYVAAFTLLVTLCCGGAWTVVAHFAVTRQDMAKSKAIAAYGVLGSLAGTAMGLILACL